jgi:uncharacterized protein with GYD domain
MPKYLFRASLTAEGMAGVLKEGGAARRQVVKDAIDGLGGAVEAFYFTFGDDDVVCIADLPDNTTAAAFAIQVGSSGTVSVSTTVLLTPEEIDKAKDIKSSWRAPGT